MRPTLRTAAPGIRQLPRARVAEVERVFGFPVRRHVDGHEEVRILATQPEMLSPRIGKTQFTQLRLLETQRRRAHGHRAAGPDVAGGVFKFEHETFAPVVSAVEPQLFAPRHIR